MKKINAKLLILIGIIHNLFGLAIGLPYLKEIAQAGFFNAVDPYPYRMAITWFLLFGFLFMILGQLALSLDYIPSSIAWSLLALSLVGVILMPVSGFWLVLALAIYIIFKNSKTKVLNI